MRDAAGGKIAGGLTAAESAGLITAASEERDAPSAAAEDALVEKYIKSWQQSCRGSTIWRKNRRYGGRSDQCRPSQTSTRSQRVAR